MIVIGLFLGSILLASNNNYNIRPNIPIHIKYKAGEPLVFGFNFFIKKAGVIADAGTKIKKTLLPKSVVVIIESKKKTKAVLTVVNDKGDSYLVVFSSGGDNDYFNIIDENYQIQTTSTEGIEKVSSRVEKDIRYLVKTVSLGKEPKGFYTVFSPFTVKAKDKNHHIAYILKRDRRYIGEKYVVDVWSGYNMENKILFLSAEDFYTKGIMAISFNKDKVKPLDKFNIIIIIDKASLLKNNN